MEQMGDQLYQIFQDGYHRAATTASPQGPPAYNGYSTPSVPNTDFSSVPQGFIQNNVWTPTYPGGEIDFPIGRGASVFNGQPPPTQQQQQQQQQLYHANEFYGSGLDINPSIGNFSAYPPPPASAGPDLMLQDPFNPSGGQLDYNASVYPPNVEPGHGEAGSSAVWPKQEIQGSYGARGGHEAVLEDVKGIFPPDLSGNGYYGTAPTNPSVPALLAHQDANLLSNMASPSPSSSHPASPRSPASSLSMCPSDTMSGNFGEASKRKTGGATGKALAAASGGGRGKRKKNGEDVEDPNFRHQKEKDRRVSNNSRERMRIRDINDALTELGRVCMSLKPIAGSGKVSADKPQTKLGVLNMAVDVIMQLEKKVRERNLNPSTVALHHRSATGVPPSASGSAASGFQPPSFSSINGQPPHQR